ncbi:MAG: dTDP-4-amino-4,6-dideoxygalactose transaminase, partial [Clostridiales bacterium]|nr:dTDP-4-amino-4,6-dideoxygalactose transaminase [Clostridiales bacterium]
EINQTRLDRWQQYYEGLTTLAEREKIQLPYIPEECVHNAHMFYIKTKDIEERTQLIDFLKSKNILSVFHYIPLHSAPAGQVYGRFHAEDQYTTKESDRLLRLPLYYHITADQVDYVIKQVQAFYSK